VNDSTAPVRTSFDESHLCVQQHGQRRVSEHGDANATWHSCVPRVVHSNGAVGHLRLLDGLAADHGAADRDAAEHADQRKDDHEQDAQAPLELLVQASLGHHVVHDIPHLLDREDAVPIRVIPMWSE